MPTFWHTDHIGTCRRCENEPTRETTGTAQRSFYCDDHDPTTLSAFQSLRPVSEDVLHHNRQVRARMVVVAPAPKPAPAKGGGVERMAAEIQAVIAENMELRKRAERAEAHAQGAQVALEAAMTKLREWEALADQLTRPPLKLEGRV